jgi:hypothetical protein
MHETRQFDVDEIRSAHRERIHNKLQAISGKEHRFQRKPSSPQAPPKEKKEDKERHETRDLHVVVARLRQALPSMLLTTAFLSSLCAFSGFLLAATLLLGCLIGERVHAPPPGPPPPAQPQPQPVAPAASTAAPVARPVSIAHSPSGAVVNPSPSFLTGDVELGFPAAAAREGVPVASEESPSSTSPPSGVLVAHVHAPTFDSSRRAADSSFMRSES